MAMGNLDRQNDGTGARNVSGYVTGRVLAATTAENMAIPTTPSRAKRVILASDKPICISFAGTAVVPADDDTGVKSEMIPANAPVESRTFIVPATGDNLSVITTDSGGANVTASWFY